LQGRKRPHNNKSSFLFPKWGQVNSLLGATYTDGILVREHTSLCQKESRGSSEAHYPALVY